MPTVPSFPPPAQPTGYFGRLSAASQWGRFLFWLHYPLPDGASRAPFAACDMATAAAYHRAAIEGEGDLVDLLEGEWAEYEEASRP